jgi:hypothetical protein
MGRPRSIISVNKIPQCGAYWFDSGAGESGDDCEAVADRETAGCGTFRTAALFPSKPLIQVNFTRRGTLRWAEASSLDVLPVRTLSEGFPIALQV